MLYFMAFCIPVAREQGLWEMLGDDYLFDVRVMNVERRRLATFDLWPSDAPNFKVDMAKEGFYYTGIRDVVKCFHCGLQLADWERRHSPACRHQHHKPDCSMALGRNDDNVNVNTYYDVATDNPPEASRLNTSSSSPSSSDSSDSLPGPLETDGADKTFNFHSQRGSSVRNGRGGSSQDKVDKIKKTLEPLFAESLITMAILALSRQGQELTPEATIDEVYKIQDEELHALSETSQLSSYFPSSNVPNSESLPALTPLETDGCCNTEATARNGRGQELTSDAAIEEIYRIQNDDEFDVAPQASLRLLSSSSSGSDDSTTTSLEFDEDSGGHDADDEKSSDDD